MNLKRMVFALCIAIANPIMADTDYSSLFRQGMEAFDAGNWGSAELLFRKVVESEDPEFLDRAWFHLARSIFYKKKYDAALFEFKSFLNRCRTDELAIASRYWMGECYYLKGDFPSAIEELRRYIQRNEKGPLAADAHDRLAEIYYAQKRWDEAVIEWEAAVAVGKKGGPEAARRFRIGEALYMSGKLDEAAKMLASLLSASLDESQAARARIMLGRIYQKNGDHARVLQLLAGVPPRLVSSEPYNEAHYLKGRSFLMMGNYVQAEQSLRDFLAVGAKSPWYYHGLYELGKILLKGKKHEEGIAMLEKVRRESNQPFLRRWASRRLAAWYRPRNPERAISYLEDALKESTPEKRGGILILLGRTCMDAKRYEKAEEYFSLYLKENPFDAGRDEIEFLRARSFLERGDVKTAMEIFESIQQRNPFSRFNTESDFFLAMIEHRKGNSAKAIERLNRYLRSQSGERAYEALHLLLLIHIERDDADAAGRTADALVRGYIARKGVDRALCDYAVYLIKKGRDAGKPASILMNRFPSSESTADYYYAFANALYLKARFSQAVAFYDRYLVSPFMKHRGDAFFQKLVSLYRLNKYGEVIETVKKADFPPMSEDQWQEVHLLQARSYYRLNMPEEAYMVMSLESSRRYPPDDILMFIRCSLMVGDYRSAMEANEYLEKDRQRYAEGMYAIGEYLRKAKKMEEAELYFQKVTRQFPGSRFEQQARLSLVEILIDKRDYSSALAMCTELPVPSDKDARLRYMALLIRCRLSMNMTEDALADAEQNIQSLLVTPYGEAVADAAMRYYYQKNDLPQFTRYAQYLLKYKGHEARVDYLSGKLHLRLGNVSNARAHFTALSRLESRYQAEAWYQLGRISMLADRNLSVAASYFQRAIGVAGGTERVNQKARIELALIYLEMKHADKAKEMLEQIVQSTKQGLTHVQAENLIREILQIKGKE